ncbi:MarR family transcriptional regulator [Solihabitans fulvus]|uniref:MarR family transcriptional regulator n=1 Tax=Solihabitans fulvus TaxID=1892852 RepID=A0A5B2X8A0_9PSEU|nr:MarR family transcriptional regulator [Solihabitans fulvus]KAA2259475.1 MarR family transcriptional regulator [Solihabitans fulvus]
MTAQPDRVDELLDAWRAELPDVLYPTSELTKRVLVLAAALDEATRRELPALGITVAEFDVLVSLRRAGAPYRMKPNQLARGLLLSSGGTSNVTNHLVANGLVVREADPDDGRSTWVRLTPDGVALAERAVSASSAAHAAVFANVPGDVVEVATGALRAVCAGAASTSPPQPAPARNARNRRAG